MLLSSSHLSLKHVHVYTRDMILHVSIAHMCRHDVAIVIACVDQLLLTQRQYLCLVWIPSLGKLMNIASDLVVADSITINYLIYGLLSLDYTLLGE